MMEGQGALMAEKEPVDFYVARYGSVSAALAALHDIEQHKYEMADIYDAAVIDKENGKLHIVKRMDDPRARIIPEVLETLPRQEVKDAAGKLGADQAGLIAISKPAVEKGVDKALLGAATVVRHTVTATTDAIISKLQKALLDYEPDGDR